LPIEGQPDLISGGGTAGVSLNLLYSEAIPPDNTNDFALFGVKYKGNANAQKNTTIKFCFITQHGAGKTTTFSTTLDQVTPVAMANGFNQLAFGDASFGGLNTKTSVLQKVTLSISPKNNTNSITIGDVHVVTKSNGFDPIGINLTLGTCNSLFTCPQAGVIVGN
jgi:hypothetical protein